ncbi:MAG TPA: phosphotransferase family protein [Acidimicrobiia bacterium]|nr:phosphotransferase family protein [Acidimicrobiia bacterium]
MDDAAVAAAVTRHLGGDATVDGLRRLSGGASRETWAFTAHVGGERLGLVLRRDPAPATGGVDRSTEAAIVAAAHDAGVLAPRVRFVLDDADHLGVGFVMDHVEGETVPRKILRDDRYASARPRLTAACAEQAARIHALPVDTLPALPVLGPRELLDQYRAVLDTFGEPHPAFELGMRRLAEEAPPLEEPRLVHGDFRNGNLVVDPDGLRAVLDWELAHRGDPIEDLGWLCVKSWRFGVTDKPVGGFGDVDELCAAYTAAGGGDIDRDRLRWWEALGTLKWGVICEMQAQTHLQGLVRSVELATLGRRIAEMEWDLLELLDDAPPPAVELPDGDDGSVPLTALQDRPRAAELLEAVREFLEHDVLGAVEGRVSFHTRVAVNALGIVERELVIGPALDVTIRERLAAFLGHDGDLAALISELAAKIRAGTLDAQPDTLAVTRALVRAKLAVANPRYGPGSAR